MTIPAPVIYIRFAPDQLPDARAILEFLTQDADAARVCAATHRPTDSGDRLELLSSGLTFELCGLAGAGPVPRVAMAGLATSGWLCLRPGEHLSGGWGQWPVERVMAGLVLCLLDLPGALGAAWGPTRNIMSAEHFRRTIPAWLMGDASEALPGDSGAAIADIMG